MPFDWTQFFARHRIEVKTSGSNVSKNNVAIHCPFCGSRDHSQHMSVNLDNRGWRCFLNPRQHKGKNPARLVQELLHISAGEANRIVGNKTFVPDDFASRVKRMLVKEEAESIVRKSLLVPEEFKKFRGLSSSRAYENSLVYERGFNRDDIPAIADRYDLRYCVRGRFAGRIIFLIYQDEKLTSWTGRSISERTNLRYMALSPDEDKEKQAQGLQWQEAHAPISHHLLWFDDLMHSKAHTLVLCEGPFDALKINVLGRRMGIVATCFFTAQPTDPQIELLHQVVPRFERTILLLDAKTFLTTLRVTRELSSLGVERGGLPQGFRLKDPGEFTEKSFSQFVLEHRIDAA
jgi:hypothetical protein